MDIDNQIKAIDEKITSLQYQREDLIKEKLKAAKDERVCKNCKYFVHHYTPWRFDGSENFYFGELRWGHCKEPSQEIIFKAQLDSCPHFMKTTEEDFKDLIIRAEFREVKHNGKLGIYSKTPSKARFCK